VFDHVTIRVSDRGASERFYDTVLAALGIEKSSSGVMFAEWADFSLAAADAEKPVTRRLHVGFAAPDRAAVDAFHRLGVAAGYRSDGPPGPRPQYVPDYYGAFHRTAIEAGYRDNGPPGEREIYHRGYHGAFVLDPDGNNVEVVNHNR
jgi:catechol 2,3-dioxygenase-like lactoylglutathione lyase family enzyme